jgi:hypothetical protein
MRYNVLPFAIATFFTGYNLALLLRSGSAISLALTVVCGVCAYVGYKRM